MALSSFNFLNELDYGHFYQFANSKTNPTITYLVSKFIYYIINIDNTKTDVYNTANAALITPATGSGDLLCFGSFSQGIVIFIIKT